MKKWLKTAWVQVGSWLVSIGVIGALILIGYYGFCDEPIALHDLLALVGEVFCAVLGFMLILIGVFLLMATLYEIDHPLSLDFWVPLLLCNLCAAGHLVLSRFSSALMKQSALVVLFFLVELILAPIGGVLLLRTLLIGRFRRKEAKDLL